MPFSKTFIQEKLRGTSGQVVSFDSNNNAIVTDLTAVSGKSIILNVHAPDNTSRIVVSNSVYTYSFDMKYLEYDPVDADELDTSDSNEFYVQSGNVHTFYLPMLGSWTIAAVKGGISTTTSIYIERVGTYDVSLSYFNAYISVTYPIGATCTCSNGIDIYYANNTDGSYTFTVNRASDWTINVYNPEISQTATAVVSIDTMNETKEVNVTYLSPTLNDNDWATIRYTISTGEASSIWHVGDIKEISLTGTFGSTTFNDFKVYAQIIEFNHNTAVETNSKNTASFQIGVLKDPNNDNANVNIALIEAEYGTAAGDFVINSTADNSTGWEDSDIRTLLNSSVGNTLINCLSVDLKEMLMDVTKYTLVSGTLSSTVDKLFIPSSLEIFGVSGNNQVQYSYYQSNSKIRYEYNSLATASGWWLRNPYQVSSNTTDYYGVDNLGTLSHANANYSSGISPIFVIGG